MREHDINVMLLEKYNKISEGRGKFLSRNRKCPNASILHSIIKCYRNVIYELNVAYCVGDFKGKTVMFMYIRDVCTLP